MSQLPFAQQSVAPPHPSVLTETHNAPLAHEQLEQFIHRVEQAVRSDPLIRSDVRDEVTQDVFIELFRRLRAKKPLETLLEHLPTIIRDVRVNHYRKAERVARNQGRPLAEVLDHLAWHAGSPGERKVDFWDSLHAALSRLPERMRVVVCAVYIDGCKQTEVASQLGISPPSVAVLLRRATEILRALLRPLAS